MPAHPLQVPPSVLELPPRFHPKGTTTAWPLPTPTHAASAQPPLCSKARYISSIARVQLLLIPSPQLREHGCQPSIPVRPSPHLENALPVTASRLALLLQCCCYAIAGVAVLQAA